MEDPCACAERPIWTLQALAPALAALPGHLSAALPALFGREISHALRERIMIAVAAENGCPYCQLAHTTFGRAVGLGADEIQAIIADEDAGASAGERLAIAFARDLARRGFASRDEGLWERLAAHFTPVQREAIVGTAQLMNLAARFGNTFDAARGRLARRAQTHASWLDLLVGSLVFVAGAATVAPVVGSLRLLQRASARPTS
jgi:AhpD family alkylhydroperoxidase